MIRFNRRESGIGRPSSGPAAGRGQRAAFDFAGSYEADPTLGPLAVSTWPQENRHRRGGALDVCAVPAAAVVGEAVVAWEAAVAFLEKFGGDTMDEVEAAYKYYMERVKRVIRRI